MAEKTIHDNLRMLNTLVAAVAHDIEKYLEEPSAYNAGEYFEDTLTAANEAQNMVVLVRSQLDGDMRNKGWAVAKSLQAQVDILLPVVEAAAADDDEYGFGPGARKALEALAAHKET